MTETAGTQTKTRRPPKVSIVGTGMVGASLAYSIVVEKAAGEVVLVDHNKDRAMGEAMDINHALPFSAPTRVVAGDYADCRGSDVIVITAGAAQKPGETRLSLVERNIEIYKAIVPQVVDAAADAVILVVSNPVDILTYATIKISGLPWTRVIGSGTVLDTARFRYELSSHCRIDPRSVHAFIIGEHGDTEVPVWSATTVAGMPFQSFCDTCDRGCPRQDLSDIFERVKNAAYDIIRLKGATYYAIALGTTRMIESVLRDENTILTASSLLHGQYGIEDVCLSLPLMLGRKGVGRVLEMPLSPEEREGLKRSADALREILALNDFETSPKDS